MRGSGSCRTGAPSTKCYRSANSGEQTIEDAIHVEVVEESDARYGARLKVEFKEFEKINVAAWWNYQRDRIVVRSSALVKPKASRSRRLYLGPRSHVPVSRTIVYDRSKRSEKAFFGKTSIGCGSFLRKIAQLECNSDEAKKCRHRFVRNREKLFTFLSHDGIPWHNNNAEHAIKAFSKLRDITRGSFTERTFKNNTILFSICQTCKYSNLEFFEFIRSGSTDIYTFAERLTRRKRLPA